MAGVRERRTERALGVIGTDQPGARRHIGRRQNAEFIEPDFTGCVAALRSEQPGFQRQQTYAK